MVGARHNTHADKRRTFASSIEVNIFHEGYSNRISSSAGGVSLPLGRMNRASLEKASQTLLLIKESLARTTELRATGYFCGRAFEIMTKRLLRKLSRCL